MARKAKRTKRRAPSPPTFEALPLLNASFQRDCKALQLPLELLMEIISYFKGIPRPSTDYFIHSTSDNSSEYLERTEATRALSQTCRYWRFTLLPLLWENLDVCATHSKSGAWYKVFGETLVRKCFLMTANPELASYVRTVNVIISRYSTATVLPAFVRGLEALPNAKVLCIASAHQKMTTALKDAFEGHTFPQVESIFLPPYCHNILRSCPSVRKVSCNDGEDASKLISAIAKECKHVEEVDGFSLREEQTVKRLVKATPKLRSLKFRHPVAAKIMSPLAACKNLSHITIQSTKRSFEEVTGIPAEMEAVKVATEIIRNSRSTGRKSVVLSFCRNYAYYRGETVPEFWSKTWEF